jgi:hypothetical protein
MAARKLQIVYVEWLDSEGESPGRSAWCDTDKVEEWAKTDPPLCRSVGFVISKRGKAISIVGDDTTCEQGRPLKILKRNVVKLVPLRSVSVK